MDESSEKRTGRAGGEGRMTSPPRCFRKTKKGEAKYTTVLCNGGEKKGIYLWAPSSVL